MNPHFASRLPSFDARAVTDTIEKALASAGLQTTTGPLREVTETIRRALASAGLESSAAPHSDVIDVEAREVGRSVTAVDLDPAVDRHPGEFIRHEFTNHAGSRAYKLYVPASAGTGAAMPLIVMLHGCTQSPDDFAAGTQMNRLAEEQGFLVAYPEQTANANGSKCWNWFRSQDQGRDGGEPSLIAGITREIVARHDVDPKRVFIAGLSAGGAMAVIMGQTYPELFAAVCAHSGLPYASAHDTPSAFAAMRGSKSGSARRGVQKRSSNGEASTFVPTLVIHGDQDKTVAQGNGAEIVAQSVRALAAAGEPLSTPVTQAGTSSRGRSYQRTVYTDGQGRPRIESWIVTGAGHAWAGGDPSGSYTDPDGPDASAEMVRFFMAQR